MSPLIIVETSHENINKDALAVFAVEKGVSVFVMGNERIELAAGHCMLVPGSLFSELKRKTGNERHLALFGRPVREALADGVCYVKNGLFIIKQYLHTSIIHEDNPVEEELAAYRLLLELVHRAQNNPPENRNIPPVVEAAIGIMEKDSANLYNIDEIAREIGVSLPYLSREFKKYTGFSPSDYLCGIRMENAKKMLANESIAISLISGMCGFSGADYFSKVFRKEVGVTPSEYRIAFSGKSKKKENTIPDEAYL